MIIFGALVFYYWHSCFGAQKYTYYRKFLQILGSLLKLPENANVKLSNLEAMTKNLQEKQVMETSPGMAEHRFCNVYNH